MDRLEMLRRQRDKELFLLLEVKSIPEGVIDFLFSRTAITDEDTLNTFREMAP